MLIWLAVTLPHPLPIRLRQQRILERSFCRVGVESSSSSIIPLPHIFGCFGYFPTYLDMSFKLRLRIESLHETPNNGTKLWNEKVFFTVFILAIGIFQAIKIAEVASTVTESSTEPNEIPQVNDGITLPTAFLFEANKSVFQYPSYEKRVNNTIPRALFLGDSIGQGIFKRMDRSYSKKGIHLGNPNINCMGLKKHLEEDNLIKWLGPCCWDIVQFNVGAWYHPTPGDWKTQYRKGMVEIIHRIHQHDPQARIVIALTTPSPLDTKETFPANDSSCPHFHRFDKEGFVASLNDIVRSIVSEGIPGVWGINDRYSQVMPHLFEYQNWCDIHFNNDGYNHLAANDWEMVATVLNRSDLLLA